MGAGDGAVTDDASTSGPDEPGDGGRCGPDGDRDRCRDPESGTTLPPEPAALPVPAARYVVRSGDPVVVTAGEEFTALAGDPEDRPLREWWDERVRPGDAETDVDAVAASLAAGEPVDVDVEIVGDPDAGPVEGHGVGGRGAGRPVRLRGTPDPSSSDAGILALTRGPDAGNRVEVDRIASVVSHDLRNPLDVAKAQLLAARERGDEEHFDRAARAHDRMERIIGDVLTLARGEDAVSPRPGVELESVVADAWDTVDTADADLVVEELPTTEADPDRLRRLFENLFRNAVEHGDVGQGEVEVVVGRTDEGGFFVADDGAGIDPGERDRVFEPGYSSGGTGLGLSIVRSIARAHGWTAGVETAETGGARFAFRPGE